jgi:7-carboxy-7-deazaguanine synthase
MSRLLRITEIFHSIQGESATIGWPTLFIRLTGCPLRCQYCDTSYAFKGGQKLSFEEILEKIRIYNCRRICITGGEPLAQANCYPLLTYLADHGYQLSLETSGAREVQSVDPRVTIVMDLKTPDSLEADKNIYSNIEYLKPFDQIKFVICSEKDYLWAKEIIHQYSIPKDVEILFSPSWGQIKAQQLAEWILKDELPVRFQLQLHKILWDDGPGR